MMFARSYGERLTHSSSSGTVSEARKYLMSFCDSVLSSSPARLVSPELTIKENFKGSSGLIVIPLIYNGVKFPLMGTIEPGAGRFSPDGAAPWAKTATG